MVPRDPTPRGPPGHLSAASPSELKESLSGAI